MKNKLRVPGDQLKATFDYRRLPFKTTKEVKPLKGLIGQRRAVDALKLGISVKSRGYNVFVAGEPGTGRTTLAQNILTVAAQSEAIPNDWCYLNNFKDIRKPLALSFPPGIGMEFKKDMTDLLKDIRREIPQYLAGQHVEEAKTELLRLFQKDTTELFSRLDEIAKKIGFALQKGESGFVTVPLKAGKPLTTEEFTQIPEAEMLSIKRRNDELQAHLLKTLRQVKQLEKRLQQEVEQLEKQHALLAVEPLLAKLKAKYVGYPKVPSYLEQLKEDVINNLQDFKEPEEGVEDDFSSLVTRTDKVFKKYQVNLLVDNSETKGAPVITESNPTYYNLFGVLEYQNQMGYMFTDFTMLKAGSVHRANGGYLILQAKDLLNNFLAWDALKRILKNQEMVIENMGEQYRTTPLNTVKPEPIPLSIKVILVGSFALYQLLCNFDQDFPKLFKVLADFDSEMPRTIENIYLYTGLISSLCKRGNLYHFDREAVTKVIEYGSRLCSNQNKISARFNEVTEIIYEANAFAQQDKRDLVKAVHVEKAVREKIRRLNRYEELFMEMVATGKLLVDSQGAVIGQVNGMAVYRLGGYSFGKPSKITAQVYAGSQGVINIERESNLSGRLHDKGVLIIAGYLGGKYAQDKPLSLTASICFEQLYEHLDGDSASSSELYAILSALAGLPVSQELAVTGSVNQKGEIQPIGGVNEKIEGFFAVCQARGLTGKQGVIIPQQNLEDLMLKDEVIEAAAKGMFHVYAVSTIDEGLELLTGVSAGIRTPEGGFTKDSVHDLVNRRLLKFAAGMNKFNALGKETPS